MFDNLEYPLAAPPTELPKLNYEFFRLENYPSYPDLPDFGLEIAVLPLSQGYFALIKREDLARKSVRRKWSADIRRDKEGRIIQIYARRVEAVVVFKNGKPVYVESCGKMIKKRKCRTIYLHKVIVKAPRGVDVDHSNGYGLDCREDNLNAVSKSDNAANRHSKRTVNLDLPRGVIIVRRVGGVPVGWRGAIMCNNRQYQSLRVYDDPERAHKWYKRMHRSLFEIQPWMRDRKKIRLPLPRYVPPKVISRFNHKGEEQIPF